MKKNLRMLGVTPPLILAMLVLASCSNDDNSPGPMVPDEPLPTGQSKTYTLSSVSDPAITGTAKFSEIDDNSVTVELQLQNTPAGGQHPAHIHVNTAAEGGGIAITLGMVDGDTGSSTINFSMMDDGTDITYDELLEYDGYINVHLSSGELGTLIAQGDIGQNELTSTSKVYTLGSVSDPAIDGTATFTERVNGEALATIELNNTTAGGEHPGHIHLNTAAEGGDIAFTFTPVNGDTGISHTNVANLDDDSAFVYSDVLDFDGYINIHLSATDLGTLIAQGDIGQNELTGTSKVYTLGSVSDPDIDGTATFAERVNGEALATIELNNTIAGGEHPGHIHLNTAAEGGDIAFTFTPVNGDTGISHTNVANLDDDSAFVYSDVLDFDGYINVHLSATDLGTLIAQGDIGQNELTGTTKVYPLASVSDPAIEGTATFAERVNGEALATIALNNTIAGGEHPGHIHLNTAAEGGDIAFTFTPVNGDTGMSITNVASLDDDSAFVYSDVLDFDGYINIHVSNTDLGTLIAQGDIGQNELTGTTKVYPLASVSDPAIEGTATFAERVNGEALATLALSNTMAGGSHPSHIHANSAAVGGDIIFTFNPVNGDTGMSTTNVAALDDSSPLGYEEVLVIDGYINVHLSDADLGTLIAQGNIGINENDGPPPVGKDYDVTNNGLISYIFNSDDLSDAENPDLTLQRGATYTFTVNASGHPFFIKSVQGNTNANAYNNGVTNNGAEIGTITFEVPMDAPDVLYYNCQFHSVMTGILNITD